MTAKKKFNFKAPLEVFALPAAAPSIFESVAAAVKPADDIAQNALTSLSSFFKKSGPFDILGAGP